MGDPVTWDVDQAVLGGMAEGAAAELGRVISAVGSPARASRVTMTMRTTRGQLLGLMIIESYPGDLG